MTESTLPGGVRRIEIRDGVRYVLPRRSSLGGLMYIPLVLGIVFTLAGTGVILLTDVGHAHPDVWIGRAFGYGFGSIGVIVFHVGIFLAFGHNEIELARDRFRASTRAGIYRWTRTRRSRGLKIVTAILTPATENGRPLQGEGGQLAMLRVTWEGGATLIAASGYPISTLSAIAKDLSTRLGPGAAAEVVRGESIQTTATATSEKPAGSNAYFESMSGGLKLNLPPRGIRRGSSGYLSFGLLWIGMMIFLNVFAYFLMSGSDFFKYSYIFATVFMVLFSGVGWAMIAAAIHLGRRRATLEMASGRLSLSTEGPFGKKHHGWNLGDILRIYCGPSGRTTNNIPHMALLIHAKGNDPVKSLEERDPVELKWVADVLTAELARAKSR